MTCCKLHGRIRTCTRSAHRLPRPRRVSHACDPVPVRTQHCPKAPTKSRGRQRRQCNSPPSPTAGLTCPPGPGSRVCASPAASDLTNPEQAGRPFQGTRPRVPAAEPTYKETDLSQPATGHLQETWPTRPPEGRSAGKRPHARQRTTHKERASRPARGHLQGTRLTRVRGPLTQRATYKERGLTGPPPGPTYNESAPHSHHRAHLHGTRPHTPAGRGSYQESGLLCLLEGRFTWKLALRAERDSA